jgi:hypothetical protein
VEVRISKLNDIWIWIGFKIWKFVSGSRVKKTGTDPHSRTRGLGEVHADGPPPVPAGLRLPEADAQVREGVQEDRQTELHVCLGARQAEPTPFGICHDSFIMVNVAQRMQCSSLWSSVAQRVQRSSLGRSVAQRVQRSSLGCSVAL